MTSNACILLESVPVRLCASVVSIEGRHLKMWGYCVDLPNSAFIPFCRVDSSKLAVVAVFTLQKSQMLQVRVFFLWERRMVVELLPAPHWGDILFFVVSVSITSSLWHCILLLLGYRPFPLLVVLGRRQITLPHSLITDKRTWLRFGKSKLPLPLTVVISP